MVKVHTVLAEMGHLGWGGSFKTNYKPLGFEENLLGLKETDAIKKTYSCRMNLYQHLFIG